MVMPVLAVLAQNFPDYSVLLVGLAIGGYGLTQALLQIPMGMLSDKFGRKPIIIGGLLVFCLGSLIAGYAESMWMLVIGRFLQGAGAIAGAIMALAADVSRESQRAKVMAIIGIAIGFSFYLALILGPVIAAHWGLSGIFIFTAILAGFCVPLVWFVVPNNQQQAPSGDTLPSWRDIHALFANSQIKRLNISVCILHCLITLFFMQIPTILVNYGHPLETHQSVYWPILLTSILGLIGLMALNRRVPRKTLMIISIVLLIIACLGLSLSSNLLMISVFAVVFFSGFNYLEANLPAWVSSMAPAGKKGSAMGMFASFQFFGAFLGGVIAGLLNLYLLPSQVLWFGIIVCGLWLVVISGLKATEHVRRYSLKVHLVGRENKQLHKKLTSLPGVIEIRFVERESTYYFKTSKQFDFNAAKQLCGDT